MSLCMVVVYCCAEVDEYRSGEDDDADDEGTLEEEEKLAKAEGRDVKVIFLYRLLFFISSFRCIADKLLQ